MLNSLFKLGFNSGHLSEFKKRTDKTFELNQTVSHLNEAEIGWTLEAMKVNKSIEVDYVHPMVMRECSVYCLQKILLIAFAKTLVILFRMSLICPISPCLYYFFSISKYFNGFKPSFEQPRLW